MWSPAWHGRNRLLNRPVERIRSRYLLAGIEREPALASPFPGPRVPPDSESLQAASRERNQVLLQRIDSECIRSFEILQLAIRAIAMDVILAVLLEEAGGHAIFREACAAEIARNGGPVRYLHGLGVVGFQPCFGFRGMTWSATPFPDVWRRRLCLPHSGRPAP